MPRRADHYDGASPYSTLDGKNWRGLISAFEGSHAFLSNFYMRPFEIGGRIVPSAEHAYQAQKAAGQPAVQAVILNCDTPGWAKRQGQNVQLRPGWDQIKVEVMRQILRAKFASASYGAPLGELSCLLLETGGFHLVEGNTWNDTFWGCIHPTKGSNLWVGSNWLGILLMERRAQLQGEIQY